MCHVGHAASAIAAGKCSGRADHPGRQAPDRRRARPGAAAGDGAPESIFESSWGMSGPVDGYALAAQRHMYEFGTTSEQLAEIKVAASHHAQHNPHAFLPDAGHRRGRARLADGQLPAAPAGLLRGHRRRRRARGGRAPRWPATCPRRAVKILGPRRGAQARRQRADST